MTRIAFYLPNESVSGVDFSKPWLGNPGVGGTQHLFMTQPYYLQRYAEKHGLAYEFILLTNQVSKLPEGTVAYSVESHEEAIAQAQKLGVDIFVYRPMEDDLDSGRLGHYEASGLKLIGWAHNSYSKQLLDTLTNVISYCAHVCVCHEQLDALLDKRIYTKSCFIFNGFESEFAQPLALTDRNAEEIVYIGSIIPAKGFHMLAEAWPEVLRRVPHARLKVIGSGKVYDRNASLGVFGIAQDDYERRFMPYLTDSDGAVLPSVQFLGLMGTEKFEVMRSAAIGVVNPTGMTENCPGSALEFQACGVPVVSAAKGGLWDTVENGKTGILVKDVKSLSAALSGLLENPQKRDSMGKSAISFVQQKFNYDSVCLPWMELFEVVSEGRPIASVRAGVKPQVWREKRAARLALNWLRKIKFLNR